MTVGSAPHREKIYTHRFPGAHSRSQIIGALSLDIAIDEARVAPAEEMEIQVLVDNSRTGHGMPSGSADLRLMWLELTARHEGKTLTISAASDSSGDLRDFSEASLPDAKIPLEDDVPRGTRVYGAIYTDGTGRPTLSSYNATRIAFDNRLTADEIREESFTFVVPEDAEGKISLVAKLYYLSYPSSFAESLGIPVRKPVEIAVAKRDVEVQ
jgi:hypothetical protein